MKKVAKGKHAGSADGSAHALDSVCHCHDDNGFGNGLCLEAQDMSFDIFSRLAVLTTHHDLLLKFVLKHVTDARCRGLSSSYSIVHHVATARCTPSRGHGQWTSTNFGASVDRRSCT